MNRKQLEDACKRLYENSNVDLTDCDLFSSLIKKHFDSTKNTAEFNHFKLYANSTLKAMTKDELIDYVHLLHHNWGASDEIAENIKKYTEKLQEKDTPKKIELMRIKKYDGYDIGICDCGTIVDTSLVDKINYCPSCGQRIDWNDEE